MERKRLEQVFEDHRDELMGLPGVVGTALGLGQRGLSILVFVTDDASPLSGQIPSSIDGFPVEVRATGEFRALG